MSQSGRSSFALSPSSPSRADTRVILVQIEKDSVAEQAGLQVEDVIVAINGTSIENTTHLRKYLYSEINMGDEVEFKVYRDGQPLQLRVIFE
ncbi:PDZ domain-containing protein [Caldalkalibacillus mannanilyticus]|uniref:PDZ domain-containing protein n=1 Tax=Caldalkalibacillus mannanilyticus TaxID=1418 RepID=UPI0034E2D17C